MISLNDLFNSEIGNEFMFADQSYIPSTDIITLSGAGIRDQEDIQCSQSQQQMTEQQMIGNKTDNSLQLLNDIRSDGTEDEHEMMTSSVDQSDNGYNLEEIRKYNHSEIEKRRREKMNMLIKELAKLVPMCNAIPSTRKLDKLTVLRMTVQHIKSIRSSAALSDSLNSQTPSFITQEVKEGFLFVVSCDRGKILYVSDSVKDTLNYNKRDLLGISWFDVLHHKDIPKVKEQLSLWDTCQKEKLVDAKTLLPLDDKSTAQAGEERPSIQLCPGSRRSFFCRMKYKFYLSKNDGNGIKALTKKKRRRINIISDKYCDLYCMGYMKSWTPITQSSAEEIDNENAANSHTGCLVAMARTIPQISTMDRQSPPRNNFPVKHIEYTSRHSMDGMYLFVDQRVTPLLGYLPQELLGTSCYDYCHPDDVETLAESHRRALQENDKRNSSPYRFKTKLGTYLYLQTLWKSFKNPWTREFEYIIAVNENVVTPDIDCIKTNNQCLSSLDTTSNTKSKTKTNQTLDNNIQTEINKKVEKKKQKKYKNHSQCSSHSSSDRLTPTSASSSHSSHKSVISSDSAISQLSSTSIMKRFINNRIKHSKIGQQIAEEILETQRRADDFSSSSSQSSNSPPSSMDIGNGSSISGSMSGSVSSSSTGKSITSAYGMKACTQQRRESLNQTDSGIDNNSLDNLSLPSIQSLSNSSLSYISQLEPLSMNSLGFITDNNPNTNPNLNPNEVNPHLNNHLLVNQRVNDSIVFNGSSVHQNDVNEETDEAAMSLIMSILEADAGLGGPVDFSGMPWPLY